MMMIITSCKAATLKPSAWVALFALTLFMSPQKMMAQETAPVTNLQKQQLPSSPKDAPAAILKEYSSLVSKYNLSNKKARKDYYSKISEPDRARLEALYKKMSNKQQSEQIVGFMRNPPPEPEAVPTDKQLEEWENAKTFGVWIDGKKVNNSILSDYSNTDFSRWDLSKLAKNAINYGKHYYQVNLMTKGYYQEYYQQSATNKDKNIMFVRSPDKQNGASN